MKNRICLKFFTNFDSNKNLQINMSSKKNKSLLFIIISAVIFVPNLAGLAVALFVLDPAPAVLYIVSGTMIAASLVGFVYGISIRNKTT